MVLDALGLVSSAQQVTSDVVSTSSVDLGNVTPKRAVGSGEALGYLVVFTAAGTNTGSIIISAIDSTAAALNAGVVKLNARALVTADLVAGNTFFIELPPNTPTQRYTGLDYDVTGTVDITITACLIPQSFYAAYKSYNKGFTVS